MFPVTNAARPQIPAIRAGIAQISHMPASLDNQRTSGGQIARLCPPGDIRSDPNQTLAEILAAVQPRDRTRCLLESIEDVLSIADLYVAHPVLEFPQ